MSVSRRATVQGLSPLGFHDISVQLWGQDDHKETIICVHGLTRNSHDFDILAASLSASYHIACPDIVGRGESNWLATAEHYNYAQYMADMNALIARLNPATLNWIGTSMGGLIGMMLAAMPGSPIKRLVINDVGPLLKKQALERIGAYTGVAPEFADIAEVEAYLRKVHAPFAPMSDENWQDMARNGATKTASGGYQLSYDPKIGEALRATLTPFDLDLWPVYDAITCPVLVLRGENSDLLDNATATAMTERGPKAKLVEIKQAGHAPSLMSKDQISLIESWLRQPTT